MPKHVRYSGQAQEWLDNQPLFISGSVKAVIKQVAAGNFADRDWQVAQMDDPFYTTPMGRAKRIKMHYRAYNHRIIYFDVSLEAGEVMFIAEIFHRNEEYPDRRPYVGETYEIPE